MDEKSTVQILSLARAIIGGFMVLAPDKGMRVWAGDHEVSAATRLAGRGVGARDLALGMGALMALDRDERLRGWLEAAAIADATDAFSALASFRELPRFRRWLALAMPAGICVLLLQLAESLDPT